MNNYKKLPDWLEKHRDKIFLFDIETDASVNLVEKGTGRYFSDPATRVTLSCWKRLADDEVFADTDPECKKMLSEIKEGDIIVAHNAIFDLLGVNIKPSFKGKLSCTRAMCSSVNLPAKLKDACKLLNSVHQKAEMPETLRASIDRDYAGDSLFEATEDQWQEFLEYGKKDVYALEELFCHLCWRINEDEFRAIDAHLRTNMRGMPFDRQGLKEIGDKLREEQLVLALEFKNKVGFEPTQTMPLVAWINKNNPGVNLLSAMKKEVEQVYHMVNDETRYLLDIRNKVSKHTASKTVRIRELLDYGNAHPARLRDSFRFAGAVTGRWKSSGTDSDDGKKSSGANMQNNERGGVIKNMVVAPDGMKLYVGDFKQVELRVALWVTGELAALKLLHGDPDHDEKKQGKLPDFYEETASSVFNTSAKKVTKQQRFFGKQLVLGANYGMGPAKFVILCKNNGSNVSEEDAKDMISKYRKERSRLSASWRALDVALKEAVNNSGNKTIPAGTQGLWFMFDGKSRELILKLPTRRLLRYGDVRFEQDKYGNEQVCYFDTGDRRKKFFSHGGLILENVCQAISRDLLCRAMIRFEDFFDGEREGVVGHVHDELIAQVDKTRKKGMLDDMLVPPEMRRGSGVKGLLLDVDSHLVNRWGEAK